ncbi:MAG TPA: hypothetical protein VGS08_05495 [Candidatus Saccharimonadales bacterium]|nr:hypothetical protein [Candidatus Saccharimonadales bacterium]
MAKRSFPNRSQVETALLWTFHPELLGDLIRQVQVQVNVGIRAGIIAAKEALPQRPDLPPHQGFGPFACIIFDKKI